MRTFLNQHRKRQHGFTLIELLIVIGILGILMTTTLIAINPVRQIAQAKNTKRKSDVIAVLNAIQQYVTDHEGNLPATIPSSPTPLSKTGVDICSAMTPVYIAGMPVDPELDGGIIAANDCGTMYETGYEIYKDPSGNQVTVVAPLAEFDEVISYTR